MFNKQVIFSTVRVQISCAVLALAVGACDSAGAGGLIGTSNPSNTSSTGTASSTTPAGDSSTKSTSNGGSGSGGGTVTAPGVTLPALTIQGTPADIAVWGTQYSYIPSTSGASTPGLAYSIVNKPVWAKFSQISGALSGTPTQSEVGTTTGIEILASDGTQRAKVGPFSIKVVGQHSVAAAPTITGTPPATVPAGSNYWFTPVASSPTGEALTFSIQRSPPWAKFNVTTGQISGAPPATDIGTYADVLITVSNGTGSATLPAFSIQVTADTQADTLRNFLTGLKGKRILSGQYADFDVKGMMDQVPLITNGTGKTPAILGTFLARGNAVVMADPVTLSNEWLAKGGIVLAMLSPGNPTYSADIMSGPFQSATQGGYPVNFNNILIPGTVEYVRWQAFLAQLVTEFKAIKGPIIVRPFPELVSHWWWWGQQQPSEFIAVWRQMVTYARNAGVTNVLWCLNFNEAMLSGYSDIGAVIDAYYPGHDYVDVVSYDAYPPSVRDSVAIAALTATGKPVIYAEMGAMHGPSPAPEFGADSGAALDTLIANFPQVVAAVVWPRTEALPDQLGMSAFMNNPKIMNLADLPPNP